MKTKLSTIRSQKFARKNHKNTQQIISFLLYKEYFALPILKIQKVIPLVKIYGDPANRGIGIVNYEDKELVVIDVARKIFNNKITTSPTLKQTEREKVSFCNIDSERYLLILESQNSDPVCLPIDSQPSMFRIDNSSFKPLPKTYLTQGNIKCVTSLVIELPNKPPIFLLDSDLLTTFIY